TLVPVSTARLFGPGAVERCVRVSRDEYGDVHDAQSIGRPALRAGHREVVVLQRQALLRSGNTRSEQQRERSVGAGDVVRASVAQDRLTRAAAIVGVLGLGAAAEALGGADLEVADFAVGAAIGCGGALLLGRATRPALLALATCFAWFLGSLDG